VVVKTNQQTTVVKGKAPEAPSPVDAGAKTSWTHSLPPPDQPLGENAALDANGGGVVAYSSERSSPDGRWDARNVDDGRLDRGWATAQGQTAHQWLIVGFGGNQIHSVSSVLIDPAATDGLSPDSDLRTFTMRVSTTGTDDASFSSVLTATLRQSNTLQRFDLPHPVSARYVKVVEESNDGSTDAITLDELVIVTGDQVDVSAPTPMPVATPTSGPSPTATAGPVAGATVYAADGPPDLSTCKAPGEHATATIHSTDPVVEVKVAFAGLSGAHTWNVSFDDPSGNVAYKGSPSSLTSTLVCDWLGVGGFPATSVLGTWTIHIFLDGAEVAATTYTLVHAPDAIRLTSIALYRESQAPPANGCDLPDQVKTSTISTSDPYAEAIMTFSVWQGPHTIHGEFHDPTGAIYYEGSNTLTDQGGSEYCFWISVAGSRAASLPGSWVFELTLDNQPAASVGFTIQSTSRGLRPSWRGAGHAGGFGSHVLRKAHSRAVVEKQGPGTRGFTPEAVDPTR
jgi:hypothetical protein